MQRARDHVRDKQVCERVLPASCALEYWNIPAPEQDQAEDLEPEGPFSTSIPLSSEGSLCKEGVGVGVKVEPRERHNNKI